LDKRNELLDIDQLLAGQSLLRIRQPEIPEEANFLPALHDESGLAQSKSLLRNSYTGKAYSGSEVHCRRLTEGEIDRKREMDYRK
jgi:hypothetical protein